MSLYDIMAKDLAVIHADPCGAAVAARYVDAGGLATPCRVSRTRAPRAEMPFKDGYSEVVAETLIVLRAEIRAIQLGGRFQLPDHEKPGQWEDWGVDSIENETPAYFEVRVVKSRRTRLMDENQEHDRAKAAARK